jgi:hypothetical protein
MATKWVDAKILPEIPVMLSVVLGDTVIRFGELERVIFTAMARVSSADSPEKSEENEVIHLVGRYKRIKTLGRLADAAKKQFKNRDFKWFDPEVLRRLGDQRNSIIHDALVEKPDGTLTWQASSTRKHRPVDYAELLLLRECVVRTIKRIDEGSCQYKKSRSNK